jgi:hypothetical protein
LPTRQLGQLGDELGAVGVLVGEVGTRRDGFTQVSFGGDP